MATSVIPTVIDTLIAQSSAALADVGVHDGYGISEDPGDFLMIGVDDPDSEIAANSADSQQARTNVGQSGNREEAGEVTCAALSWNGDADPKAARDAAFAITAALEDLIAAAHDLGLGPTFWFDFGTQLEVFQQQHGDGASCLLIFRIAFHATRV